jgi:hypothetical protein
MKDEPGSRLEDGQDDEEKSAVGGTSEFATKVLPTDEGGHTGPPLRNAMQPFSSREDER